MRSACPGRYDSGRVDFAAVYFTPIRPGVARAFAKFAIKPAPGGGFANALLKAFFGVFTRMPASLGHLGNHTLIDQVPLVWERPGSSRPWTASQTHLRPPTHRSFFQYPTHQFEAVVVGCLPSEPGAKRLLALSPHPAESLC